MDEIKDELQQGQAELERPKSVKEYVQERLEGLANGTIEPPARRVGRPRGPNYGKPWTSKANPNDPVSMAKSAAGKKGRAVNQSKIQTEVSRKKFARIHQADLDAELTSLKTELDTYSYIHRFEKQDTYEFVFDVCRYLLQDMVWKRKYPRSSDDLEDDVSQEDQQYCSIWPDVAATDILTMAKFILHPDRTGLKNLAVKTLEAFLDSKMIGDSDLEKALNKVKLGLPRVKDGTIYEGPVYDDPRLIPLPPPPPINEIWDERHRWEQLGRDSNQLRRVNLEDEQLRIQTELETAILEQKAEEIRQERERQLQSLPPDALNYLQSGNVFGSHPTRR